MILTLSEEASLGELTSLLIFSLHQASAVAVLNKNTEDGVVTSPSAAPLWVLFWSSS